MVYLESSGRAFVTAGVGQLRDARSSLLKARKGTKLSCKCPKIPRDSQMEYYRRLSWMENGEGWVVLWWGNAR